MARSAATGLRTIGNARRALAALGAAAAIAAAGAPAASAAVVLDGSAGTGPPPATLGGHAMTPFPNDVRTDGGVVTTIPGPRGDIALDREMHHCRSNFTCLTDWSESGYDRGHVYVSADSQGHEFGRRTLTMPPDTGAVYFYVTHFDTPDTEITATTQGASSGPVTMDNQGPPDRGAVGARFFGFYTTGSSTIESVTIESTGSLFVVGQFGWAPKRRPAAPRPPSRPRGLVSGPLHDAGGLADPVSRPLGDGVRQLARGIAGLGL